MKSVKYSGTYWTEHNSTNTLLVFFQPLLTADGATSEHGDNAVLSVEVEHKNAREPAPIPLRLMVERSVQDPAKKHRRVILIHAMVSTTVILMHW